LVSDRLDRFETGKIFQKRKAQKGTSGEYKINFSDEKKQSKMINFGNFGQGFASTETKTLIESSAT